MKIPNVFIADKQIEKFNFKDDKLQFMCIPYFTKARKNYKSNDEIVEYIKIKIKNHFRLRAKGYQNVCIAHYAIDKVFEGIELNEPVVPIEVFKKFDYVALGHIHEYEMFFDYGVVGGYSGSSYKVNFGENYDKFFNVQFTLLKYFLL